MNRHIQKFYLCFGWAVSFTAFATEYTPIFKPTAAIEKFICKNSHSDSNQTNIAQIDGRLFKRTFHKSHSIELEKSANEIARLHKHLYYAFGHCNDRISWAASFPAFDEIQVSESQLILPWETYSRLCKSVVTYSSFTDTDFVAKNNLKIGNSSLITDKTSKFAVMCHPKYVKNTGPILMHLVDVRPEKELPLQKLLTPSSKSLEARFLDWVNAIRTRNQLKPLTQIMFSEKENSKNPDLESLSHDRLFIASLHRNLNGIELIGENKVIGHDLIKVSKLLWDSPPHRELLLSKIANSIHLSSRISKTEPQQLSLHLLLAKVKPQQRRQKAAIQ